ncbi:MAG TPA: hypothetical protein DDY77_00855 [Clostridiales bacterium]|nr:hypothetical protein [Clostridiales bacterium]
MGKAYDIVAEVLMIIFLAMLAFAVWFVNGLLFLPFSRPTTSRRGELLIYNLSMEKVYFPENLEAKFYVSSEKDDCEVRYAYFGIDSDPSEYIYAVNNRGYEIERKTFESWFRDYVIDDVLVDKKGKAKVKDEYRPKFSDDERYYYFKYKDTARLVYVFAVYNKADSSFVLCMQTTPYPNEKKLSADKVPESFVLESNISASDMSFAAEGAA